MMARKTLPVYERKEGRVTSGGWGNRENLGGHGGGENATRIYCMKIHLRKEGRKRHVREAVE